MCNIFTTLYCHYSIFTLKNISTFSPVLFEILYEKTIVCFVFDTCKNYMYFKVYCFTGNIKNDLVKYFMQPVQNGLIIHLTNSLQNDINFVKTKFKPKNMMNF